LNASVPAQPALTLAQAPAGSRPAATVFEGICVLSTVLVVPVALYLGNLAPHARLLYPVSNFALAAWLYARRSPWYVGHCLLVFCFVSLVRRLADQQGGWDPSNPILLTPYLCSLFTVLSFLEYWWRPEPRRIAFFVAMLCCIAYGTALAILNDRVLGALVDALKWSIGPLFAVHLLAHRDHLPQLRAVAEPCLVWAGAAMAAYGIAQFINPAPWDVFWMRNVAEQGLGAISQWEPFRVRVFGTMNSPGSLAAFLSAGIIVGLRRNWPVALPTVMLMLVGLALCQYRAIWAATALGVLAVGLSRSAALPKSNLLSLLAVALMASSATAVPRIREVIVQRAASLKALKDDESLRSRLEQYADLTRNDHLAIGEGLAINGASRRLDKQLPVSIDGGLIEIWRAMGALTGTIFLLSLLAPVVALFAAPAVQGNLIPYDRAVAAATFILLPMGSVHIGECGFCAWMFLGFGLATLPQGRP